MRFRSIAFAPEVLIAIAMFAILLIMSAALGLQIVLPSGGSAAFVGVHYIYPLAGVAILGLVTLAAGNKSVGTKFLIACPCYAVVLFVHFNIKLWIPHINPTLFDEFYYNIDQSLRPVVDLCMWIRIRLSTVIPYSTNLYMLSYIVLFYVSFLYHALRTPAVFGQLIVAALILQALGTFAYLVAPAIGPFIYESGVNPFVSQGQQGMLTFYEHSRSAGPGWLAQNGGVNFTAGLAAMPSLHSASAFLFFLFAWRYGRVLVPLYALIMAYILVTAIASRWHYIIDVPFGIALAWVSVLLASRLSPPVEDADSSTRKARAIGASSPLPSPVGVGAA